MRIRRSDWWRRARLGESWVGWWPSGVRLGAQPSVETEVVVMSGQLALVIGDGPVAPAAVWETLPPEARAELTMVLARLVALMAQEQRDE